MFHRILMLAALFIFLVSIVVRDQRDAPPLHFAVSQDSTGFFMHPLADRSQRIEISGLPPQAEFVSWSAEYAVFVDLQAQTVWRARPPCGCAQSVIQLEATDQGLATPGYKGIRLSHNRRYLLVDGLSQVIDPVTGEYSAPGLPASTYQWFEDTLIYQAGNSLYTVRASDQHETLFAASGALQLLPLPNAGHWVYFLTRSSETASPALQRINLVDGERQLLLDDASAMVVRVGRFLYAVSNSTTATDIHRLYRIDLTAIDEVQVLADNVAVTALRVSNDQEWLAYIADERSLRTVNLQSGQTYTITDRVTLPNRIQFADDNTIRFVEERGDAIVFLASSLDGTGRQPLTRAGATVSVVTRNDPYTYVHATDSNALLRVHSVGWRDTITTGSFFLVSPDGQFIVGTDRRRVQVIDVEQGEVRTIYDAPGARISTVIWSEHGITFMDAASGRHMFALPDGRGFRDVVPSVVGPIDVAVSDEVQQAPVRTGRLLLLIILLIVGSRRLFKRTWRLHPAAA